MTWLDVHEDAFDEMCYPEGVEISKLIQTLERIKLEHKNETVYFKTVNSWDSNYQYIHIGEQD